MTAAFEIFSAKFYIVFRTYLYMAFQINFCVVLLTRTDGNEEFDESFSQLLLIKLFETAIKLCTDNEKARSNGVRTVGNLLRYLPDKYCGTHLILLSSLLNGFSGIDLSSIKLCLSSRSFTVNGAGHSSNSQTITCIYAIKRIYTHTCGVKVP